MVFVEVIGTGLNAIFLIKFIRKKRPFCNPIGVVVSEGSVYTDQYLNKVFVRDLQIRIGSTQISTEKRTDFCNKILSN